MADLHTSVEVLFTGYKTWHRLEKNGIVTQAVVEEVERNDGWTYKYPSRFQLLHLGRQCPWSYKVAQGKFAKVYACQPWAYKIISMKQKQAGKYRLYLRCNIMETCLLHSLHHPNLSHASKTQMIMKHGQFFRFIHKLGLARTTWLDAIENHEYTDEKHAAQTAGDVLSALTYLHAHDVVHGDLKPNNILLYPEGAQLADFNLSSLLRPEVDPVSVGPQSWRAPECLFGAQEYLKASEMWGLGLMLLDCAYGCIFTKTVLKAQTDEHLAVAYQALLTDQVVPDVYKHRAPGWDSVEYVQARIRAAPLVVENCQDLLAVAHKLLRWRPEERLTAEQVWQEPFFQKYALHVASCPRILTIKFPALPEITEDKVQGCLLTRFNIPWVVQQVRTLATRIAHHLRQTNCSYDAHLLITMCAKFCCFLWFDYWPKDWPLFEAELFHVMYLTQCTPFSWYGVVG